MFDKKDLWYQFRIIGILLATIIFLLVFWFFQYKHLEKAENLIVQTWAQNQYKFLDVLVENETENSLSKETLVSNLISSFSYTDMSYGFLYQDGKVLFEQNSEITKSYRGKAIRSMYGAFSYYGGEHLQEPLKKMEEKTSGVDYLIKSHRKGKEWVTFLSFQYGGNHYVAGIATPESFILNEHDFYRFRADTYVFGGVYTLLLILLAGMLCFFFYRFKETVGELEHQLKKKTDVIRAERLANLELQDKLKQLTTLDFLTGLYNRTYFDVLVGKLRDKLFLPVSICIFNIDGLKRINDQWGSGVGDEVIRLLTGICKNVFDEQNDVVARYGNDEVIVLMINTPFEFAQEKAKQVCETMEKTPENKTCSKVSYAVSTKVTESSSIVQTIAEAEEKLQEKRKHK